MNRILGRDRLRGEVWYCWECSTWSLLCLQNLTCVCWVSRYFRRKIEGERISPEFTQVTEVICDDTLSHSIRSYGETEVMRLGIGLLRLRGLWNTQEEHSRWKLWCLGWHETRGLEWDVVIWGTDSESHRDQAGSSSEEMGQEVVWATHANLMEAAITLHQIALGPSVHRPSVDVCLILFREIDISGGLLGCNLTAGLRGYSQHYSEGLMALTSCHENKTTLPRPPYFQSQPGLWTQQRELTEQWDLAKTKAPNNILVCFSKSFWGACVCWGLKQLQIEQGTLLWSYIPCHCLLKSWVDAR